MDWLKLIVSILEGIIIAIPLVCSLCQTASKLAKEKQWNKLVDIMIELMMTAEKQFTEGAAKKAWVMNELRTVAKSIDYNYDAVAEQKISDMIDAICTASKEMQKAKT